MFNTKNIKKKIKEVEATPYSNYPDFDLVNIFDKEPVKKSTVKQLLKNRFYIVPGFTIKCAKFFSKITPTPILARCTYHMQKRKDK